MGHEIADARDDCRTDGTDNRQFLAPTSVSASHRPAVVPRTDKYQFLAPTIERSSHLYNPRRVLPGADDWEVPDPVAPWHWRIRRRLPRRGHLDRQESRAQDPPQTESRLQ